MSLTQTTGGTVCNLCSTLVPLGQIHRCNDRTMIPLGDFDFRREFSENEIRQIIRDEIRRAGDAQRRGTNE